MNDNFTWEARWWLDDNIPSGGWWWDDKDQIPGAIGHAIIIADEELALMFRLVFGL